MKWTIPEEHHIERRLHANTSYDAREALQATHKVRTEYSEARTLTQLDSVQKNRTSKFENKQYILGNSRTNDMAKKYRVREDTHKKKWFF